HRVEERGAVVFTEPVPAEVIFGHFATAFLRPRLIRRIQDRERDPRRELDDVVAGGRFKAFTAAAPMPGGVDEIALPDYRETEVVRVESEVGLLGIPDGDGAGAAAVDEVAVNDGFLVRH